MDLLSPKDNADDLDSTDPGTLSEDDILAGRRVSSSESVLPRSSALSHHPS